MTDVQPPVPDPTGGSIVVMGTGTVSVVPDVAELRLGVAVARPTVEAARAAAATAMGSILAAVAAAGVAARDVRTTLLSVQPRYDYRDGQAPLLTGYELANTVDITIRDTAAVADVVDGTLRAGATSMDGLSFRVSDPAPVEREARIRAVAAARERADVLAEAAGLTIIGVTDIVEGSATGPLGPRYKAERMLMAADVATPVEAGSSDIAVTVTVSYRVR